MRLAAVYNVFDGEELLAGSIRLIRQETAFVVAVTQSISNRGEVSDAGAKECERLHREGLIDVVVQFTPELHQPARLNEARKRRLGLEVARESACTHFLHLDCDEYYEPASFRKAKSFVLARCCEGTVCRLKTYFGAPDLQLSGFDGYHVPFIHQLSRGTTCAFCPYPFVVDPTRSVNAAVVVELPPELVYMHHFSWVRRDIRRKIDNSSSDAFADAVLKAAVMQDFARAQPGQVVRFYQRELARVALPAALEECFNRSDLCR
jgi:hypothetical protein